MDVEMQVTHFLFKSIGYFYRISQVHGLHIEFGIGDLKLHLTTERMMFLSLGG
jgi:hypothetical protein